MKKSAWYVILLLIVLILAIVVSVGTLFKPDGEPSDSQLSGQPSEEPQETDGPDIIIDFGPEESPEPTPEPEETPEPTPEPSPEPTPEPTPEATEEPVQNISASGSFSSDTGTGLNIQVDWNAYNAEDGSVRLSVDISASHYSFFTSSLYNALEVTIGGDTYYANSAEVSYDGDELQLTKMASFDIPVDAGSANIDVVWHYRGTYSGVELDEITASGSAWIG